MKPKTRLAGRFLPSRVYARWLGTVRCGLILIPLVLFLIGGIVYYLTPSKYRSTAVFEYRGKRSAKEAAALLVESQVVKETVENMGLVSAWGVDHDTAIHLVQEITKVSADPDSGYISVRVTHTNKETARDLAKALPAALDHYEHVLFSADLSRQVAAEERSLAETEEISMKLRDDLQKLVAVRGDPASDPVARLDVEARKKDWDHSRQQELDTKARIAQARREMSMPVSHITMHSDPQIAYGPHKDDDASLGSVIWEALGTGLGFALAAPYLLELALPRLRRKTNPKKITLSDVEAELEAMGLAAEV